MINDSELLKLAANGDETAFLTLYHRHHPPVFRFALHMSGSIETAEEVVQEVFMSLLSGSKSAGFIAGSGNLQGYLIGMARNMVRGRLRLARRFVDAELAAGRAEAEDPV